MSKTGIAMLIGCLAVGVLRFIVPVTGGINHDDIFKDLAHIFVGILIGMACGVKKISPFGWMALGMTILEVVAFILRKS